MLTTAFELITVCTDGGHIVVRIVRGFQREHWRPLITKEALVGFLNGLLVGLTMAIAIGLYVSYRHHTQAGSLAALALLTRMRWMLLEVMAQREFDST